MGQYNLVIQTAFIGDLALTVPLLKNIKSVDPDIPLILICRKGMGELFLRKKIVDQVFEITKKPASNWDKVLKELRQLNFKMIVCPHQSIRSAVFVSRLQAEEKIGYRKWWNIPFFNRRVKRPLELPEVPRQMVLLGHKKLSSDPELLSARLEPRANNPEKKIFLAPGSEWATKRWTVSGFVEVGNVFRALGYEIIVTGAESERNICGEVVRGISGAKDYSGKTSLLELYELYRNGSLLVANDNGASHIAACADLPVVSIFGPTVPEMGYRPWTQNSRVAQLDLSCRPCSAHGTAKCPLGTHECMKNLNSEVVVNLARELIKINALG